MRRYTRGLTQAELATKHPMTDAIVAALEAAGVVVSSVSDNKITTDVDDFLVRRGYDSARGGATNRRAELFATTTSLSVDFPDGPKMTATIKKFIGDVRSRRTDIDAQNTRNALLCNARSKLSADMDVIPSHVGNSLLIGPTCTLQLKLRNVPLDKAADVAAQVTALLAANGIG